MRTIAVANQKGGCGKTTVSLNLAASLADQGQRTLLVDMDPQGHCAVGLGLPENEIRHTVMELLAGADPAVTLEQAAWQIAPNFNLLASSVGLAQLEGRFATAPDRHELLRRVLAPAAGSYDWAVVDCPPSLGLLTLNALSAADEVLIPVEAGFFALHGLSRQLEVVEGLHLVTGRPLGVRILCNLYDPRTRAGRKILSQLRRHFSDLMATTVVHLNTRLKAAAEMGQPITEFDRSSVGFNDFAALAKELLAQPATVEPLPAKAELLAQAGSISRQAEQLLADSRELIGATVPAAPDPLADGNPASAEQKIEAFYGVRQTADGVVFAVEAPDAASVFVAGDFNDWSPHATPLAQANGRWTASLLLPSGLHRYRLVVDGRWMHDPHNNYCESNPYGELNSLIEVK